MFFGAYNTKMLVLLPGNAEFFRKNVKFSATAHFKQLGTIKECSKSLKMSYSGKTDRLLVRGITFL